MDRQQMISELAEMGENRSTLDQLSDEGLKELYDQKKNAVTTGAGPGTAPAPVTMGDAPTLAAPGLSLKTVGEYARAEARTEFQSLSKGHTAGRIDSFLADMVKERRVTPAQADQKNGPVRRLLTSLASVHKFGEGESDLERQMAEIRTWPVLHFGEKIPEPHQQSDYADVDAQTKAFVARKNGRT